MSAATHYFTELADAFGRGWNRFWFTPADPAPCAALRIAVGLLAALHLASLGVELDRWYGREGLLPPPTVDMLITGGNLDQSHYHFTYLAPLEGTQLAVVHALAIAAALAFAAGLFTRVSGVLTLIAVLAYVHRVPQVAGHAEPALAFLLLYLCIAPSGSRLSLDRWIALRRADAGQPPELDNADQPSVAANVALRLIQVHLAMFVLMMGLTKLSAAAWWDGDAIWHLLAQPHSRPLDLTWLGGWPLAVNFWTHAALYYELAFPVLVWNRSARPLLIALGVVHWLLLILATGLTLLGLTMIVASAAFLPAPTASRNRRVG